MRKLSGYEGHDGWTVKRAAEEMDERLVYAYDAAHG
jgi:hypothetical protein